MREIIVLRQWRCNLAGPPFLAAIPATSTQYSYASPLVLSLQAFSSLRSEGSVNFEVLILRLVHSCCGEDNAGATIDKGVEVRRKCSEVLRSE